MKYVRTIQLVASLAVFVVGACAPATAGGDRRNPDVISETEITAANTGSAYDVVQRLRPQWLRARSAPSFGGNFVVMVYVDNIQFGEVEALRSIPAQSVAELEWIDATTATQRWGTGNAGGAIAVSTRR